MSLGNAFPVRSTVPDTVHVQGLWTGAGAADCTLATDDPNSGIVSVDQTATGKYTVYLSDIGAKLVNHNCRVHRVAGEAALVVNVPIAGISIANKSVNIEIWDVDAGAALTDVPATAQISLDFTFAKNKR